MVGAHGGRDSRWWRRTAVGTQVNGLINSLGSHGGGDSRWCCSGVVRCCCCRRRCLFLTLSTRRPKGCSAGRQQPAAPLRLSAMSQPGPPPATAANMSCTQVGDWRVLSWPALACDHGAFDNAKHCQCLRCGELFSWAPGRLTRPMADGPGLDGRYALCTRMVQASIDKDAADDTAHEMPITGLFGRFHGHETSS